MTFSADHSQDFLFQSHGIQQRRCGSWKVSQTEIILPSHDIHKIASLLWPFLLGIRSIMDLTGVFGFLYSAHYTVRFSIDTRLYVFIRHLAFFQIDPCDPRYQHTPHRPCGDHHVYNKGQRWSRYSGSGSGNLENGVSAIR